MVPTLKAKGFRCTVEEAVLSNHQNGYAHLLSLVGTREAVKAIWARLMKNEAAYLTTGTETRAVRMNAFEGAKLLTERLPSGAFHGLLLSKALLRGELLVCEREENLPARFCRLLSQTLRLPLHEAWRGWLWAYALEQELVVKLGAMRLHAYAARLNVPELEQAVRMALLAGELPEIRVSDAT